MSAHQYYHRCFIYQDSQCVASQFCSVRFGSVKLCSVRIGSFRLGSVRFGSIRLGSVRFGSLRLGSVRFGSVRSVRIFTAVSLVTA